ncbi:MAG: hypothetical protein NVS3B10_20480 [Polyangiales bacterium]
MLHRFMAYACAGLLGVFVGCASELRDPARFDVDGGAVTAPAPAAPPAPSAPPEAGAAPLAPEAGPLPLPEASLGTGDPACIAPLLAARCATNGCHDNKGSAARLDLASPGVSARLRGMDPASTGACAGKGKLIDPAAPDQSIVYTRVLTPPLCGTPMPPSGALTPADVDCFKQWVESVGP